MAEKTPDSFSTDAAAGFGLDMDNTLTHIRLPYITENIDNNDTFTIGTSATAPDVIIKYHAWEASTTNDIVSTLLVSSKQIGFGTASSNNNGYLHLWISG